MEYELVCTVDAPTNKKDKKRITWLKLGIICCTIAAICELLIEQYIGLTFIIPALFMVNYKKILASRLSYTKCVVNIYKDADSVRVKLCNCVQIDNEPCSSVYETDQKRAKVSYTEKKSELIVKAKWQQSYRSPQNEQITKNRKERTLTLYTDKGNAQHIKELLM